MLSRRLVIWIFLAFKAVFLLPLQSYANSVFSGKIIYFPHIGHQPFVQVKINGVNAFFMLDTGARRHLLFSSFLEANSQSLKLDPKKDFFLNVNLNFEEGESSNNTFYVVGKNKNLLNHFNLKDMAGLLVPQLLPHDGFLFLNFRDHQIQSFKHIDESIPHLEKDWYTETVNPLHYQTKNNLVLKVQLEEKDPALIVLDTGSSYSFLKQSYVQTKASNHKRQLYFPLSQSPKPLDVLIDKSKKIHFAGSNIEAIDIYSFENHPDLSYPLFGGEEHTQGIIGMDILSHFMIIFPSFMDQPLFFYKF